MPTTQKLRCQVERIVDHGEHVYTVELRPERSAPRFRPGQFLHLALDDYDPSGFWPESRVFSIASTPAQRDLLRISYSVRGRFTARMERELVEGRQVWVKLPYGEFVIEDASDVVLFAGGTGITAFTAFLDGLTPELGSRVRLAHGARTASLLLYREMLERRAADVPSLQRFYFVERPDDESSQIGAVPGRLSVEAIWPHITAPSQVTFYLSGPPAMLKTLAADLRRRGITADAIRIDAWE
ncbi:MAG: FAD-dependent oxidoreductase [Chloroflexi bacterium]|nr:FAD-dependent oxidoreductase [Chloroflexota bacterium]